MKVRIKNFNGELPCYLTEGKVYLVNGRSGKSFLIYDDFNERVWICLENCTHIGFGSWKIVE